MTVNLDQAPSSKQQVFLITGGSSGIGLASAKRLVETGAQVVLVARSESDLKRAAESLGPRVTTFSADVTQAAALRSLVKFLSERYTAIDGLFVNAGIAEFVAFEAADEAHFERLISTNLKGAFLTTQYLLPLLKSGSSIVFTSSVAASIGSPWCSVYSASKGALEAMARSLAAELLTRGVRVNCVSPGPTATPILSKAAMSEEGAKATAPFVAQRMRMGRLGADSETAAAVAFLLSPAASFITAQTLAVDGGMSGI